MSSKSIQGTLAEKYLRNVRGIELDSWPKDLKFHPGLKPPGCSKTYPALVIGSRNNEGQIQQIQAIFLDKKTAQKAKVDTPKMTLGSAKGAIANLSLPGSKSTTAVACEGPEDALSIVKAMPDMTVYATLGKSNLLSIPELSKHQHLIIAFDNDGKKLPEMGAEIDKIKSSTANRNSVWVTQPNIEKFDYNSMLKNSGKHAEILIRETINCAKSINATDDNRMQNTFIGQQKQAESAAVTSQIEAHKEKKTYAKTCVILSARFKIRSKNGRDSEDS